MRDAPDGARGIALATEAEPDVALLDLMMPGELDGMAALAALRERVARRCPVVMMSGRAGLSDAVRATKLGAFNFLEKPLTPEGVLLALASALELRQARREARALRADLGLAGEMIGDSPAMRRVREMIARVAPTDARVLITGESGTGKELVAAAIHAGGARKDRPFVRVNCAAIPRDLVESEMFGHERGAFTGATERRIGRFELAHTRHAVARRGRRPRRRGAGEAAARDRGGGDRARRRREADPHRRAHPLGDEQGSHARGRRRDVPRGSVLPAQRHPARDPAAARAAGRHSGARAPLLGAAPRRAPASRSRRGAPTRSTLLARYRWPGNVRELANIVERLAILHAGREVTSDDVREVLPAGAARLAEPAPLPNAGGARRAR